jgi:O-antigen ligase
MPIESLTSPNSLDRASRRPARFEGPNLPGRPEADPALAAGADLLVRFHTLALLSVFPCTMLWWPLYRSSSFSNFILLDCAYLALWVTSLALLLGRGQLPWLGRQCVKLCVFGLVAAWCSAIGSLVFGQTARLAIDLLRQLRGLGFASIIPLSMYLASTVRIRRWVAVSVLLSTTFNVGVQFTGYQEKLPLFNEFRDLNWQQTLRPTGAVSNANDYAYISLLGLAIAIALWSSIRRSAAFPRLLCFTAVGASLYGVLSSGSRSAMVGLLCGAVYYITKRRISTGKKLGLIALTVLALAIAWRASSVFQERMDLAMTQRMEERDLASRIEAQSICLRTWVAWPLGVGFSNMPEATAPYAGEAALVRGAVVGSDNIYVDYLLGAGIQGLAFLLLCFGACWKLAKAAGVASGNAVLQSAIVALLCCGFASVAPASMFVAPFFFAVVGIAALPEGPLPKGRRS